MAFRQQLWDTFPCFAVAQNNVAAACRGEAAFANYRTVLEAEASSSVPKGKVARTSEKAAIDTEVSWRASLAKTY